jgi:uncharacterized protein YndB with AHSA1/START domain
MGRRFSPNTHLPGPASIGALVLMIPMHFALSQRIKSPPLRVFEFFADPHNRPHWQRSLKSVAVETPGRPRLGTRWRESPLGLGSVAMEITAFEAPYRWSERGSSSFGSLELTLTFAAEASGTEVLLTSDLVLRAPLLLLEPLLKPLLRREMKQDLARAASILEATPAG